MRNRRWDRASQQNLAYPGPPLMRPNAYDSKVRLDHKAQTVYMGPVVARQPVGQIPYDNVNIIWEGGGPASQVIGSDDFSVDHTSDAAWWADGSNFSHVVDGKQDFSSVSSFAIFKKPAKATAQTVIVKFVLVDSGDQGGVSGVVPALSVQDNWGDLFSLGMFWQRVSGPFWVQGQLRSDTSQPVLSDVFYLNIDTEYWMRARSHLEPEAISCEIFNHDPGQIGSEPLFTYTKTLVDVPKLAVPAYTGLHMIGANVLLDEYRVELLGEDTSGTVKNFDFKTVISHKYSGAPKWRYITVEWCLGPERLAFTTYPVYV